MELIHGAHKFGQEDVIGNMPDNVITNILDRLPLRDAVRTDILSKNWRFKWTMLSQLIFDERFFAHLSQTEDKNNHVRVISRLLLHLRGTITKFVLSIDKHGYTVLNDEDISHWILFLSRKGIKDLTIQKGDRSLLKLPIHLFSCLELKHLKLFNCYFNPPPTFHGFPNLLSLELCMVKFESGKFGEFFTQSPVLEILDMSFPNSKSFVKMAEIANLASIKILSMLLCNFDYTLSSSTIFELLGFLPKIQELHLDFLWCKLTEDAAKKRFPINFPSLKTLKLTRIDLSDEIMLSFAFELIGSFQNLEILEITARDLVDSPTPEICSLEVDYNTMGSLKLRSVVFTYYKGSENELCLVKYLLACSPFLKKIVIRPCSFLESDKKFMFARKLLKLHRASSAVDIDLY
ncbi:putative F-box domain, FBD domain, leucine-rich repeat domain superfamily [Helianthus annuus]|nr:putative F-box domain, FBD domain, leucine-rich repeat domain superfamily [Helianthus annuus]